MAFQSWTTRSRMSQVTRKPRSHSSLWKTTALDKIVATAVQKKGHDKFVERFLLKSLESFGVTREMVLQTDKETGPIDVAKHVAAERKATTIIRQTSHEKQPIKRVR